MKLSSISLIPAALAAIAGSATVAHERQVRLLDVAHDLHIAARINADASERAERAGWQHLCRSHNATAVDLTRLCERYHQAAINPNIIIHPSDELNHRDTANTRYAGALVTLKRLRRIGH